MAQDCKNQHILALLSIVQPVKFLSKSREHTGKNKPGISSIKICLVANIYSMLFPAQAAAGMLYAVLDFGPLSVVESVQIANKIAGDPADALEGDLCKHGDNAVFLRFAGPSDGDFNNGPAVLLLHHFNGLFYNLLGDVLRIMN